MGKHVLTHATHLHIYCYAKCCKTCVCGCEQWNCVNSVFECVGVNSVCGVV